MIDHESLAGYCDPLVFSCIALTESRVAVTEASDMKRRKCSSVFGNALESSKKQMMTLAMFHGK